MFSGTTFVRISSASHAAQRIARTPLLSAHLLLGSIQHSERHPEVTRCGDELFVIDLAVNRRTLIPQGPTFVPVACESATARLRRPGATTCSSCSVDARLMRGAACIGMGGLSQPSPDTSPPPSGLPRADISRDCGGAVVVRGIRSRF